MTRYVSGSTNEYIHFVAFSTADHVTRVTGLTAFNVYAAATSASTGSTYAITVNEVNSTQMPGVYRALLADSTLMTIPSGVDSREICLHFSSSMDPVTRTFDLYRRTATTGQTLALNTSGKIADVESVLTKVTSIENHATSLETNLATANSKLTSIEANTTSIVVKTNSLNFTVAGQVDANIQYVNDVLVNGVGSTANPWGP